MPATVGWVLRSTRMDVERFPRLGEHLVRSTFCSATAHRWAERTTVVRGADGARLRAVAIWVAVDTTTSAPVRLGDWFFATYGPSSESKRASARLTLTGPTGLVDAVRPSPLRQSDLDAWGHVNNAIAWGAVEDAVQIGPDDALAALVEHQAVIDPGAEPVLATKDECGEHLIWFLRPT